MEWDGQLLNCQFIRSWYSKKVTKSYTVKVKLGNARIQILEGVMENFVRF